MAAGTAASLVPIRSITRRIAASDPKSLAASLQSHPRLSVDKSKAEETITYIPDTQEDAGPLCLKLLAQLKGIQMGKAEDKFGWCFKISEDDQKKATGHEAVTGRDGNGQVSVGQTD